MIAPDDIELRVVGCLVEKQRTTPDQYPLTLNSLRLACNQSTNRDPVVDYDEATIRKALGELGRRRWIRSASGHTSRAAKYRQLIDVELNLPDDQISILAVLMLRGPQTPGELKQRVDRLHHFEDLSAVQQTLEDLIEREYVERLDRRPGQKEERYHQLLGGGADSESRPAASASEPAAAHGASPGDTSGHGEDGTSGTGEDAGQSQGGGAIDADRIERLELEVASLREQLEALTRRLG